MSNRIFDAMDMVHAESTLKEKTRETVYAEINKRKKYQIREKFSRFAAVAAGIVILCFITGGSIVFYRPVSAISIDVNPSLELQMNCFDRVISANGYNEDGKKFCDSINVKYKNYKEALEECINQNKNSMTVITVSSDSDDKTQQILHEIKQCQWSEENVYCTYGNKELVEEAHEQGISFGKYKVYLQLLEQGESITIEEACNMKMQELCEHLHDNISDNNNGNSNNNNGKNNNSVHNSNNNNHSNNNHSNNNHSNNSNHNNNNNNSSNNNHSNNSNNNNNSHKGKHHNQQRSNSNHKG